MHTKIPTVMLALALSPFVGSAATKVNQHSAPVPYDADLYRKDTEVVSAHGEFIYWTVQEGALDYAQKMHHSAPATAYAVGDIKSASYHLDPGVRIGVSYFNAPKYWEVRAQYTHLSDNGKTRANKPSAADEYLTGTWPQIISDHLSHAHSSIHFNYNLFDLFVDRMFIPNPHLRLRMLAGLGVAWISQHWKIQYFNIANQNTTIKNLWHYVGGGMRAGLSGDWFWGNDIYLTGLTTLGLYMGSYSNTAKQTATTESLTLRDSHLHDTRPVFTTQFNIGPSWQKNFTHNRAEVFVGYELSAWFNLQEIHRSSSNTTAYGDRQTWINSGIIALHGLTTRLTLDF